GDPGCQCHPAVTGPRRRRRRPDRGGGRRPRRGGQDHHLPALARQVAAGAGRGRGAARPVSRHSLVNLAGRLEGRLGGILQSRQRIRGYPGYQPGAQRPSGRSWRVRYTSQPTPATTISVTTTARAMSTTTTALATLAAAPEPSRSTTRTTAMIAGPA